MSILTIISKALAYEDLGANSNPTQTPINWGRTIQNLPVVHPATLPATVEPLGTLTVVDGSRATAIDGTSAFSLSASPLHATRYRILHTGGTAPAFRTDRAIAASGIQLTLVVGSNLTLTVTAGSGTPFSGIQPGDAVFLPGVSTGDAASPFNNLNEGYWTTLAATGTVLTLSRASGEVFSGASEVVTPSANTQFQAFSTAGVQVGDTVELAGGFASTSRRAYAVAAVNPSWVEIVSTSPLGAEAGIIPTATGLVFYKDAKRWIAIESDQEVVVRVNGDTSSFNRVTPWVPGDRDYPGEFRMTGPVWKLQIVNRTTVPANVTVLSAE